MKRAAQRAMRQVRCLQRTSASLVARAERMWMNPRRDGFTLTELAALLLPSLCKAKAQAHSSACQQNLRQIGFALCMYVGEFSKYPTRFEWAGSASPGQGGRLLPYFNNNREIFTCPARKPFLRGADTERGFGRFSYGYNCLGSGRWDSGNLGLGYRPVAYVGESQIRMPSDMIAAGDVGNGGVADWLLNPNEDLAGTEDIAPGNSWLPANRHRGGATILFCDGHVEHATQKPGLRKQIPRVVVGTTTTSRIGKRGDRRQAPLCTIPDKRVFSVTFSSVGERGHGTKRKIHER